MTILLEDRTRWIAEGLRRASPSVQPSGEQTWELEPAGASTARISARLAEDWLILETPYCHEGAAATAQGLSRALQANAGLCGGVKIGLSAGTHGLWLSAEIPLDDEGVDLPRRLSEAIQGFDLAVRRLQGIQAAAAEAPAEPPAESLAAAADAGGNAQAERLQELCRHCGWPFTERHGGELAVPLEVPGAFYQALLAPTDQGGVRLAVELETVNAAAPATRTAVDVLLLSACRAVRVARAAARPLERAVTYQWEVAFAAAPGDREFAHALSALSVACRLTGREVAALQEERIAREYLMLRGWSSLLESVVCL